ncbi:MAG: histidine triad nucleotide-binding protein [Actinobacteria bacterium]|nr:histidine triad nucleotide-binding protein [Actinomycetota bacterium]
MKDPDCLFCKIAGKEVDSDVVSESDLVVAFRDTNPAAPTHVLLIPKDHIVSARELKREHGDVVAEIFEMAARIASDEGLDAYRIVTNVGPGAGQSVSHLHLHLLGGRSMSWPPG